MHSFYYRKFINFKKEGNYFENGRDAPHVNDVGAEELAEAGVKAEERDAKEERQEHKLDDKVAAVLDAQQGETGDVEEAQGGGQQGEHGRHVVRPNAAEFPARLLLGIDVAIRIAIPPVINSMRKEIPCHSSHLHQIRLRKVKIIREMETTTTFLISFCLPVEPETTTTTTTTN
jgi:hypothetical protein